jgi:hypothetical protein
MSIRFRLFLMLALLLITAQRLPAPIQELSESPTPAPRQSAKPQPKRSSKPKVTNENSVGSTKRLTPLLPQGKPTPQRILFDGTWRGTIECGLAGDKDITFQVSANGTVLTTNIHFFDWPKTLTPTCDGHAMTWKTTAIQTWTLTPNSDGRTAVVTGNDPGALFGLGAFNSSAIFRKMSP